MLSEGGEANATGKEKGPGVTERRIKTSPALMHGQVFLTHRALELHPPPKEKPKAQVGDIRGRVDNR